VYPIGIDVPKFLAHIQKPPMRAKMTDLRRQYNVSKLIIGVDRLDYTKGLPHKIAAIERFLDTHPQFIGQVSMVQVAVPSREGVQDYKDLATSIHHQVEALNQKYGESHLMKRLMSSREILEFQCLGSAAADSWKAPRATNLSIFCIKACHSSSS
jgi:trehalose-6-phosphate synthase